MRPEELEYIRPRDYAAMRGVHYRTIINHFNKGALDGYRDEFGNIWIRNPRWQEAPKGDHSLDAILYARVSSSINMGSLDGHFELLRELAAARGYRVVGEYKEVASGLNEGRKMLGQILDRDDYGVLVAEHRDRLTRFGLSYLDQLLGRLGVKVDIINQVDGKDNELVDDFVSIVTSFCGRIYGQKRRAKTNRIIDEIRATNKKGGVADGLQKEKVDSDSGDQD